MKKPVGENCEGSFSTLVEVLEMLYRSLKKGKFNVDEIQVPNIRM